MDKQQLVEKLENEIIDPKDMPTQQSERESADQAFNRGIRRAIKIIAREG